MKDLMQNPHYHICCNPLNDEILQQGHSIIYVFYSLCAHNKKPQLILRSIQKFL